MKLLYTQTLLNKSQKTLILFMSETVFALFLDNSLDLWNGLEYCVCYKKYSDKGSEKMQRKLLTNGNVFKRTDDR